MALKRISGLLLLTAVTLALPVKVALDHLHLRVRPRVRVFPPEVVGCGHRGRASSIV